jgi:NTP pyrophosphatase (non-canonical NTP hydrolase)
VIDIKKLQAAVGQWASRNFPCEPTRAALRCTLGVCEEAGELSHAVLKREQGIRGTAAEHAAAARDAIGDIIVYLMDFCDREGWSLEKIIEDVTTSVLKRDWVADPTSGNEK